MFYMFCGIYVIQFVGEGQAPPALCCGASVRRFGACRRSSMIAPPALCCGASVRRFGACRRSSMIAPPALCCGASVRRFGACGRSSMIAPPALCCGASVRRFGACGQSSVIAHVPFVFVNFPHNKYGRPMVAHTIFRARVFYRRKEGLAPPF